jgi:Ca2+-binding EF-hand superfamily protein
MTDQAIAEMDAQEVYSGTPGIGIYMNDEGIAPAFLADDSDLAGDDGTRPTIRKHSFIKCLRELSLTESQKQDVKSALRMYDGCKAQAVKRAKEIYRELQAAYKQKYQRIYQAFQAGTITEREFKKLVEELGITFKKELRSLHIKEKLDNAFAECFRDFLRKLKAVLTETQWNSFIACYHK